MLAAVYAWCFVLMEIFIIVAEWYARIYWRILILNKINCFIYLEVYSTKYYIFAGCIDKEWLQQTSHKSKLIYYSWNCGWQILSFRVVQQHMALLYCMPDSIIVIFSSKGYQNMEGENVILFPVAWLFSVSVVHWLEVTENRHFSWCHLFCHCW